MGEGNEKMFGSIRSILSSAIQPFSYLNQSAGASSFSIRDFIENDKSGWLFLSYRDDMLASQKKIIATQVGIAARATLSQSPSNNRRTWLIIDECASMGRIDSLDLFLTKARKSGGCAVLGLQSVSQLKMIYGRDGADVMLANLSSWLVLRVPDQATSEYMSRYLGDSEIKRTNESSSDNGESSSEQVTNTRVVMASTLQSLKTRSAYLNLAGDYPTCEIFLELPPDVHQTAQSFIQRDMRGLRTIPAATALGVASSDTSFIDNLLGNDSAIEDVEADPDPFKPKPGAFDIHNKHIESAQGYNLTGSQTLFKGTCPESKTVAECWGMGLDAGTMWRGDTYQETNTTLEMRNKYNSAECAALTGADRMQCASPSANY